MTTKLMPWDGIFDHVYPSKKTSIKRYVVELKHLIEVKS